MRSISGNNYTQGAFQGGGNLSFHLQLIRDQMQGGVYGRGCTAGLLKVKERRETDAGRTTFVLCLPGSGYNCVWVYIPMYNCLRLASGESVARLSH